MSPHYSKKLRSCYRRRKKESSPPKGEAREADRFISEAVASLVGDAGVDE